MDKVQKIREEVERLYKEEHSSASTALHKVLDYIDSLPEEPVSKDLEEAAIMYAKEEYNHKNPATLPDRCRACYAPLTYAFKAGAEWQKEQMRKDAIDGEVGYWNLRGLSVNVELPRSVEEGDKVKVIVIKED